LDHERRRKVKYEGGRMKKVDDRRQAFRT
jgi:hypothetical protein